MSMKLAARWILAHDGHDHVLVEDGEMVIDAGKVVSIGPRGTLPGGEGLDLGEALIAPGFVDLNALADVDTTILGFGGMPVADAKSVREGHVAAARDLLTTQQMVMAARGAFCQLLLSGVTTALPVTSLLFRKWAENAAEFEAVAALSDELGLRLVLGPSFRSAINVVRADGSRGQVEDEAAGLAGLADAVRFIKRLSGGLVSGLLVPSTIETCSDALIRQTAEQAAELNVPFRLHCCQSQAETEMIWGRAGRSSIGLLRDLGALSPRALLPHAKLLGGPNADPDLIAADREALAESGAVVVHCPLVIGRGGKRLNSFADFTAQGIRIGMGTDTTPPNMLMNLQAGLTMARISDPATRPADIMRAATLGGAAAIGRPDLGRLAPGSAADLVVWDLAALEVQPVHDPVEALFLMPPGLRPRHVWVAGRQVVRDAQVVGIDEQAIASAMQAIFVVLRDSFATRHPQGLGWPALFPPSFPLITRNAKIQHGDVS
ncbi:MAG: chlorohydrolase family protein [Cypionkella sp.]|jgi:cytosine/adenosine deaminase-related metal-dependent hydrolase|nr:chlorohydrolase family protein [Cypionkella sp.]